VSAKKRPSGALERAELEGAALRYLDRFDTSEANLRRVLARYVQRVADERGAAAASVGPELIEELVARYVESGVLSDARFAETLAGGLRRKGSSRAAILQRLRARGVDPEVADRALGQTDGEQRANAEIEAARALVRRRRLGPFRPEPERSAKRKRDLGVLARAGFDLDVARRALGGTGDDEEEW
jgi:regulatory protein